MKSAVANLQIASWCDASPVRLGVASAHEHENGADLRACDVLIRPNSGNPRASSLPIGLVGRDNGGRPESLTRLVGSGFLIAGEFRRAVIVTAGHVAEAVANEPDARALLLGSAGPDTVETFLVTDWRIDKASDLAVGMLEDLQEFRHLEGFTLEPDVGVADNGNVYSMEFSDSLLPVAGRPEHKRISPLLRKGYVIQRRDGMFPRPGAVSLEVSYPALKGASGAAVVSESTNMLRGIVIANRTQELLATHIETTVTRDGDALETTRFTMPHAIATSASELRRVLRQSWPDQF